MYKSYLQYCFAAGAVAAIIFVWLTMLLWQFYRAPVVLSANPLEYHLSKGVTSKEIAYDLQRQALPIHPRFFMLMASIKGDSRHLYAGGYRFQPGTTANQILTDIASGNVAVESLTIIEGWTFKQMLDEIAQNKYIDHQLQGKSISEIATVLNIPYANPEGWFFPDTYNFTWGTTDIEILQNAYKLMAQHLQQAWDHRAPNLPYRDPYQALIVASMIVKEAQLASEQPIIAGVILNRLHKRMRLQIDPTVIYGMGDSYQGKITTKALRARTPYNTYTIYGLPPTPISLPGELSLQAALHPESTDYLYFAAKGDGSHEFSSTLKQQDRAVKKYILHEKQSSIG